MEPLNRRGDIENNRNSTVLSFVERLSSLDIYSQCILLCPYLGVSANIIIGGSTVLVADKKAIFQIFKK